MFNRLFNVLKANLNSALEKDEFNTGDKTVDEIYDEYVRKVKEAEQQTPPPNNFQYTHTHKTPPPQWTVEELEAFKALEIQPGAPFEQIKVTYKALMKKYHPDKYHNEPSKYKSALELSQKINKAFDALEKKYAK